MKRFRKILARWFGLSPFHGLLQVAPVPEWTQEDAAHLKSFLQNPTGQKLLLKARSMQAARAVEACNGKHHPRWVAGLGWSFDWIESLTLSGESPAQDSLETDYRSMADAETSLPEPA